MGILADFIVASEEDAAAYDGERRLPDSHCAQYKGDLRAWSTPWSETEELSCAPEDILPLLNDLRRLSKVARAEAKSVYLWNCV